MKSSAGLMTYPTDEDRIAIECGACGEVYASIRARTTRCPSCNAVWGLLPDGYLLPLPIRYASSIQSQRPTVRLQKRSQALLENPEPSQADSQATGDRQVPPVPHQPSQ